MLCCRARSGIWAFGHSGGHSDGRSGGRSFVRAFVRVFIRAFIRAYGRAGVPVELAVGVELGGCPPLGLGPIAASFGIRFRFNMAALQEVPQVEKMTVEAFLEGGKRARAFDSLAWQAPAVGARARVIHSCGKRPRLLEL